MKVKTYDQSNLGKYSNKWLALDPASMKVVVSGNKVGDVLNRAKKEGIERPVLTRAPKNYGAYIGFGH